MTDRVPKSDLRWQRFPLCTTRCKDVVATRGAHDCLDLCPHKFRATPNKPYAYEDLSQDDLDRQKMLSEAKDRQT